MTYLYCYCKEKVDIDKLAEAKEVKQNVWQIAEHCDNSDGQGSSGTGQRFLKQSETQLGRFSEHH